MPLLIASATNISFRPTQSSVPVQPATQASMAPPSPPARRGRSRRTGRKFIGFDDDDFSGPVASSIPESVPESMTVDPPPAVESQPHSQGLFVTQDPDMVIDREISPIPESQDNNFHKRKRSPSPLFEESEEEDLMSRIAPAAAVLKKQKLERGESIARPTPAVPKPQAPKPAPEKIKQEINVVEITRRKNEEAAALAAAEREALQEQLEGIDIEQIRNLAIIEEMPVTRKPPPIRTARADESDRWNDKWNGRKDFGRFRRRGATNNRSNQRVIVALEEAKNKDFGIGVDRWDGETESQRKKKKDKGRDSQTQSTGGSAPKSRAATRAQQILASEAEDEFGSSEPEPELAPKVQAEKEASDSDLEIIAPPSRAAKAKVTAAFTTRGSRSQKSVPSQQESLTHGRNASGKRSAESAASSSRQPPAKKLKQLGLLRKSARSDDEDEDEDSDDEMKFKFRRPRK
jgi:nijmegen breakage syndrome protein 1